MAVEREDVATGAVGEGGKPPSSAARAAAVARYTGYALVLTFFGLAVPSNGFFISYQSPFVSISSGEAILWLGHAYVLFPACCALAFGFSETLGPRLRRVAARIDALDRRQVAVALVVVFAAAVALAWLGHAVVLLGYPITDDEYAAKFGGQILASGHVMVPRFDPPRAFSELFLYTRDGLITSFDTPGAQLPWAVAEVTGLGSLVFAVVAAIPFVALPIAVGRRLGTAWSAVALLVVATSPMSVALSLTTQTHVVSRGLLAAALCLYVLGRESGSRWQWAACGLAVGASFACRPFETAFLALPFAGLAAYEAARGVAGARAAAAWFALGAVGPVIGFALHSWAVTGNPLVPARLTPNELSGRAGGLALLDCFGINTSFNLLALAVWFLGPLGLVLVPLGALRDAFTKTLTLSVLSALALGVLHRDTGLHVVGPIHYSECLAPLTVLAVYGAVSAKELLAARGFRFGGFASLMVVAMVLGLGVFSAINAVSLNGQARIQAQLYGLIAKEVDVTDRKAVLFAPRFGDAWNADLDLRDRRSWVFEWRRPRPDYSDDVLIFSDRQPVVDAVRAKYPDRRFYRMETVDAQPFLRIVPLD